MDDTYYGLNDYETYLEETGPIDDFKPGGKRKAETVYETRSWFSPYMIVVSRYGKDKYFICSFIYSRRCGRPAMYTRASRDISYEDCENLLPILEEFRYGYRIH